MAYFDRPNRWPWPPLLYGFACIAAFVLGMWWAFPVPDFLDNGTARLFGGGLVLLGLGLDGWAIVALLRRKTAVMPNAAAATLVTEGPFAFSRNPIYLGNTTVMIGIGLAFSNPWFFFCAVAAAFMAERLAIRREEAHLQARFGDAWEAYRRKVRRWL